MISPLRGYSEVRPPVVRIVPTHHLTYGRIDIPSSNSPDRVRVNLMIIGSTLNPGGG